MASKTRIGAADLTQPNTGVIELKLYPEPEQWPERHKVKFEDIQKLGKTRYQEWAITDGKGRNGDRELRHRVCDMVEKARRLVAEDKVEMDWRLEIEPLVYKRFQSDVHCRLCDRRIWIPRLNATQAIGPDCQCDGTDSIGGSPGVDQLFDVRSEYRVNIGSGKVGQRDTHEKPDKVIALRQTGSLYRLLRSQDTREDLQGKRLWETIGPTLSMKERHPVMFPFLVAEAKSSVASGSFIDYYEQISAIVGKSLAIQAKLYDVPGVNARWSEGPVTWVLINRGPDWEISAAYPRKIEERCSRTNHPCIRLWKGSVCQYDGALQLLLIMDYIYEWARGYHRPKAVEALELLAKRDDDDLDRFSDLPSIAEFTVKSHYGKFAEVDIDEEDPRPNLETSATMRSLAADGQDLAVFNNLSHVRDSTYAVFRDMEKVDSRFVGVLVTADCLEELRKCEPPNSSSPILFALDQILYNAAHGIDGRYLYLKRCHFADIEYEWTEQTRRPPEGEDPQETLLALPTFTAYFSSEWVPTRELSIIGISTVVVQERLAQREQRMLGLSEKLPPKARIGPITEVTKTLRDSTFRTMVAACVNGSCVSPSKLLPEGFEEGQVLEQEEIRPGYLLQKSNSKWRAFALSVKHARFDAEELGAYVLDSQQEIALKHTQDPTRSQSDFNPWMETSTITSVDRGMLVYAPPANPFQGMANPAETAMYCLYCFESDGIAFLQDIKSSRLFIDRCLNSERMTKVGKKSLRWNALQKDQFSEGMTLEVGRHFVKILCRSIP